MLTFEQIKELIDLVSRHGLHSLEIERAGMKVRLQAAAAPGPPPAPLPAPIAAPAAPAPAPAPAAPPAPVAAEGALPADAVVIKSPIVGTFYSAPSPDADPYVRAGDRVKKGQVLCIVEAMKLMNEIESDVDGVILEIFPKSAQPVEFEEPLFAIRTG